MKKKNLKSFCTGKQEIICIIRFVPGLYSGLEPNGVILLIINIIVAVVVWREGGRGLGGQHTGPESGQGLDAGVGPSKT